MKSVDFIPFLIAPTVSGRSHLCQFVEFVVKTVIFALFGPIVIHVICSFVFKFEDYLF